MFKVEVFVKNSTQKEKPDSKSDLFFRQDLALDSVIQKPPKIIFFASLTNSTVQWEMEIESKPKIYEKKSFINPDPNGFDENSNSSENESAYASSSTSAKPHSGFKSLSFAKSFAEFTQKLNNFFRFIEKEDSFREYPQMTAPQILSLKSQADILVGYNRHKSEFQLFSTKSRKKFLHVSVKNAGWVQSIAWVPFPSDISENEKTNGEEASSPQLSIKNKTFESQISSQKKSQHIFYFSNEEKIGSFSIYHSKLMEKLEEEEKERKIQKQQDQLEKEPAQNVQIPPGAKIGYMLFEDVFENLINLGYKPVVVAQALSNINGALNLIFPYNGSQLNKPNLALQRKTNIVLDYLVEHEEQIVNLLPPKKQLSFAQEYEKLMNFDDSNILCDLFKHLILVSELKQRNVEPNNWQSEEFIKIRHPQEIRKKYSLLLRKKDFHVRLHHFFSLFKQKNAPFSKWKIVIVEDQPIFEQVVTLFSVPEIEKQLLQKPHLSYVICLVNAEKGTQDLLKRKHPKGEDQSEIIRFWKPVFEGIFDYLIDCFNSKPKSEIETESVQTTLNAIGKIIAVCFRYRVYPLGFVSNSNYNAVWKEVTSNHSKEITPKINTIFRAIADGILQIIPAPLFNLFENEQEIWELFAPKLVKCEEMRQNLLFDFVSSKPFSHWMKHEMDLEVVFHEVISNFWMIFTNELSEEEQWLLVERATSRNRADFGSGNVKFSDLVPYLTISVCTDTKTVRFEKNRIILPFSRSKTRLRNEMIQSLLL